jgi:hypothetical protein
MRESPGWRRRFGAPKPTNAHGPVDKGHQHKEQGPSKYEFEGPCHESSRLPPGFPGPSRCVQSAWLALRFRSAFSSFPFPTRSLPPSPPALGDFRV